MKILNNSFALHARTVIFGFSERCYAVFKRIASSLFLILTAWLYHMAKIFFCHMTFRLNLLQLYIAAWLG